MNLLLSAEVTSDWKDWIPLFNAVAILVVMAIAGYIAYRVGRAVDQLKLKQWHHMSRKERLEHLDDKTL